jgi:predicted RNase H-like HicB family nuclease
MSKSVKLLNAMKNNPNDWEISQLQTVAKQNSVDWRHDGGSHCVFITEDGRTLSVPAHRPIKPIYIKKFVALIERVMFNPDDYHFEIYPLSRENGGGFLISYPDFSECISDGETINEAIKNGRDALISTMKTLEFKGFDIPEPSMLAFA